MRRAARVLALVLCGLPFATKAEAHVAAQSPSLRQHLTQSDASLHVEFLSAVEIWEAPDGSDRQEYFRVRILERLAGDAPAEGELEFFPHAEGLPDFRKRDRALLFLDRAEGHPGLSLPARRFTWFSSQAAGDEWKLRPDSAPGEGEGEGARILAWARAWLAWLESPEPRDAALRALLISGMRSGVRQMQSDALLELVRVASAPGGLGDAAAVAELAAAADDPSLGPAQRAALLVLLEPHAGRSLDGHWRKLLADVHTRAARRRLAATVAASPSPAVAEWLRALAKSPDSSLRRAAVSAQARRGGAADLRLLEAALKDPDAGVARAAIRVLGELGTPEARRLLAGVAEGSDQRRGRWAAAALRRTAGSE